MYNSEFGERSAGKNINTMEYLTKETYSQWESETKESDVKPKEHLERLYKMRDHELSKLWQNSVVLGAFVLGAFKAFGACGNSTEIKIACSVIGIIISVLWIVMAKASKSWFEVHEFGIMYLEKLMGIPYPFAMGNFAKLKRFDEPKLSNCLLSCKGGRFSPSKINIVIGQLLLIVWIFCLGYVFYQTTCCPWYYYVIVLVMLALGIIGIKSQSKSSALKKPKEGEDADYKAIFEQIVSEIEKDNHEQYLNNNNQKR